VDDIIIWIDWINALALVSIQPVRSPAASPAASIPQKSNLSVFLGDFAYPTVTQEKLVKQNDSSIYTAAQCPRLSDGEFQYFVMRVFGMLSQSVFDRFGHVL